VGIRNIIQRECLQDGSAFRSIAYNGGGLVFVCEANNTKLVLPVSPEGLNGSNQAAAVTGNPVRSPCAYEGLPVTASAKF
jgi:hypothetical protein